ncbi:uncharacterized protein LOC125537168 [Triticum urartu]|uniref:uncharacterized protein LOC125537168 n=1 Tax=Triticum urartu TaxID=4572 RepID=UPI002044664C|nr:uncharacterized protein LOC125537168 [Triticum urartu]
MPPRRRETWGYRGVRARPSGSFSVEIRFRRVCLGLGNFDTANEAARAYDAVAWCLWWPHRTLNFPNVPMRTTKKDTSWWERAQELAPLPRLITDKDRRDNRRREHRLGIAEMDEEAMALWRQRFLQDIINEREFYTQRRMERDKRMAERAAYREDKRRRKADAQFNMRLGAASPWESDDDRYLHAYSQTSEEDITEEESDDEEDIIYLC